MDHYINKWFFMFIIKKNEKLHNRFDMPRFTYFSMSKKDE